MASHNSRLEKLYHVMLALVTSVMVVYALLKLGSHFDTVVALTGMALVLIYILLAPVAWVEWCIQRLSDLWRKSPRIAAWLNRSPEVNPRILAVLVVYFTFIALLITASVQFVPLLSAQVRDFSRTLPGYVAEAESRLLDWSHRTFGDEVLKNVFKTQIEEAQATGRVRKAPSATAAITAEEKEAISESVFRSTVAQATVFLEKAVTQLMNRTADLVVGTFRGFVYGLAMALLVFYGLLDSRRLKVNLLAMLPRRAREPMAFLMDGFHHVMSTFIKGQVLLGMMTGTYMFIIYSLFQVEFAIFLGVFMALAEILPVIGTWVGLVPAFVVMLLGDDPGVTLWVWLCSYLYQSIKDNVIAPKVVGDVMGLHPVVVIIALVVCGKTAGLVGILWALPLASLLHILLRFVILGDRSQPWREVRAR